MAKYKGIILANVRAQISKLDVIAPAELGGGVRNPEGIWEWLLCENEILVGGIDDYQIVNSRQPSG